MVEFIIDVAGTDADRSSLWDWLRQEPGLRGMVKHRNTAPAPESMGSLQELVVEALVGGAVQTVVAQLGQALTSWLTRSRSGGAREAEVTVTTPSGHTVILTARNAALAAQLLGIAQAAPAGAPADQATGTDPTPTA